MDRKFVTDQTAIEIIGGKETVNLFDDPHRGCAVFRAPETPKTFDDPKTRIERLKKHFANFGAPIPEVISSLTADDLLPSDICFVHSNNWVQGRVVLIGDAAHAMEPFAGIGASMGMEDSYVLADELCQLHSPKEIHKALDRFIKRRVPRVELARQQTRQRYWWLNVDIPGIAPFRQSLAKLIPIKHFTKYYKTLLETEP